MWLVFFQNPFDIESQIISISINYYEFSTKINKNEEKKASLVSLIRSFSKKVKVQTVGNWHEADGTMSPGERPKNRGHSGQKKRKKVKRGQALYPSQLR